MLRLLRLFSFVEVEINTAGPVPVVQSVSSCVRCATYQDPNHNPNDHTPSAVVGSIRQHCSRFASWCARENMCK